MKEYFSSKWSEEEIKAITLDNPPDLQKHLDDMKDAQLRRLCDAITRRESIKPVCIMTKVKDDNDLSKCKFYFTLTDLLIREYNSGADFKLVLKGGTIKRLQIEYSNGVKIEIYPFTSYGLNMYRIMRYGIINTDPILKNRYIFERVWENRRSYLMRSDFLVKSLDRVLKE